MGDRRASLRRLSRPAVLGGLLSGVLSLSACMEMITGEPAIPEPCPPVLKLADAAELTRFTDGPGRDLIDVDFTARISHISGKCFYERDPDTGDGQVRVTVKTEFKIDRGPANKTHEARFDYFVSLLDEGGRVIDKPLFPYQSKYWKNRQTIRDVDAPVELIIPLRGDQYGTDFTIYVGFQLTQEELDFNKEKLGR